METGDAERFSTKRSSSGVIDSDQACLLASPSVGGSAARIMSSLPHSDTWTFVSPCMDQESGEVRRNAECSFKVSRPEMEVR